MANPQILYVPGLLPKPEPELHRDALQRCLLAGLLRVDPEVGDAIEASEAFDIVAWTFDFYREHRSYELDRASIDAVIDQQGPAARDVAEARSWLRRLTRSVYRLGDWLPFLIPHLANERTTVHLRDLFRYVRNDDGIADHTRRMLKIPLRAAAEAGRPVLLIGHSMGSVIAWDALWQMSHVNDDTATVDLWLTMGSPLGQRFVQRRLLGHQNSGSRRYPGCVRRWINLHAAGDLTALDVSLSDDFAEMAQLGLLESIEDRTVENWFRLDGALNVHSEYGYLANDETARVVAEWWRLQDASSTPGSA